MKTFQPCSIGVTCITFQSETHFSHAHPNSFYSEIQRSLLNQFENVHT